MKKYQQDDLLRDWSSVAGSSVKIKLLKSYCHDDEQQASGKKIKRAFDPLVGDRSSCGYCHCAGRTHHCSSLMTRISIAGEVLCRFSTKAADYFEWQRAY
jgi:hypothetical protein